MRAKLSLVALCLAVATAGPGSCAQPCKTTADCPANHTCAEAADDHLYCFPNGEGGQVSAQYEEYLKEQKSQQYRGEHGPAKPDVTIQLNLGPVGVQVKP